MRTILVGGTISLLLLSPLTADSDALAEKVLRRYLPAGLGLLCAYQFLTWLPHYLTWPWWSDHDVFATAARAWDVSILPYRDFHLNNFPGTIYLFWILGKLFGWGATPSLYAFDAALVIAFGLLLCAWSRVQFGRLLPGLAGYALFLSYYLGLSYALAAQRDWHGPFFMVAALFALQTWPGRGRWIAASACAAVACSFRPQAVVFVPALIVALDHQVRQPGDPWRLAVRPVLVFALCTAAGLAVLFFPLVRAGVFDDFLLATRTLRPGGDYSDISFGRLIRQTIATIATTKVIAVPMTLALVWNGVSLRLRRLTVVWGVAYVGAFLYGLFSPRAHLYLMHPVMTLWSVLAAVLIAIVLEDRRMTSSIRLALVILVLASGVSLKPLFSDLGRSVKALVVLGGGEDKNPDRPPLGYTGMSVPGYAARYDWGDYRSVLAYLRELPPTTRVANVLDSAPALTGPTGRLSAFPAESIAALAIGSEDREELFAEALLNHADSVVVWSPAEVHSRPHHSLPRLLAVIQTNYQLDRAFGTIEVWRRR